MDQDSKTKDPKISFFSKNLLTCPGCKFQFPHEELRSGRGRLNAGDITVELRREYIPTQKYGVVIPLLYPISVCPKCLFSTYATDFSSIPDSCVDAINNEKETRQQLIVKTLGTKLDFTEHRNAVTGLASYILAFACTVHLSKHFSPTARRGLFALRGAWLANDLYKETKLPLFKELQENLYYQSYLNYDVCIEKQIKSIEPFDGFTWMGPDIDSNFGYDGLLYITSYLTIKHLDRLIPTEQIIKIAQTKRVLSRIFGVGKSNKNKPHVLVEFSKQLYANTSNLLDEIESNGFDIRVAEEIENAPEEE